MSIHRLLYLYFSLLGLPVPAVPAGLPSRTRKTPVKKRNTETTIADSESTSESSDDSDEDWVPGSEEVRKRNKMIKRFIPGKKSFGQKLSIMSFLFEIFLP